MGGPGGFVPGLEPKSPDLRSARTPAQRPTHTTIGFTAPSIETMAPVM